MTAQLPQPLKPKAAKVIHNLTWEQFEELDRALEDFAGVRLAYLDGTAEIMPIGREHEDFKSTMVRLIEAYMDEAEIRFYKRGSPSLGNKELGARNEPDESYNLATPKPYPDLVIEVIITSGGIDKLEGYRRMGVTEVWFWEDGMLGIHHLRTSGYEKVSRSELLLDLPIDLFCRYITYHDQYDAVREFRQAIRSKNQN
ncbi:MAG: Uma2 family endonuclease [Cyanobacteria bacterium CRU_2_1]|nr:Uma2 family endonuclease [Cyanobacteria bacterium RU_5_0]NJR58926.1 Uma2 family endonuclease [Cyanobacteria bacterium CRU_2_1]